MRLSAAEQHDAHRAGGVGEDPCDELLRRGSEDRVDVVEHEDDVLLEVGEHLGEPAEECVVDGDRIDRDVEAVLDQTSGGCGGHRGEHVAEEPHGIPIPSVEGEPGHGVSAVPGSPGEQRIRLPGAGRCRDDEVTLIECRLDALVESFAVERVRPEVGHPELGVEQPDARQRHTGDRFATMTEFEALWHTSSDLCSPPI